MANKKRCIPFENGNPVEYTGYDLTDDEVEQCYQNGSYRRDTDRYMGRYEWRPNLPFRAVLSYDGYARGRSSAGFVFKDENGHRYWMFMTDIDAAIRAGVQPLEIRGEFEFVKRGQNYGVRFIREVIDETL